MVDMLEKFFSVQAIALDKTVDGSKVIFVMVRDKLGIEIQKILSPQSS